MADAISATGLIRIHPSPGGPVAALRGLDLRVGRGEIAAIVGPSGSGKSTLLRLLAGLDRPSAGRLQAMGVDLTMATDAGLTHYRRNAIGIVDQHYRKAVSPYLTAEGVVGLPLALRGVSPAARRARVGQLLDTVGLGGRGRAYRHELSGGEQQRLAFAAAMAPRPSLLLADEPTGELDGVTALALLELVRDLVKTEGATCVIVTHDPAVERVADRVVHVADGRVVAEGRRPIEAKRAVDAQGWLAPTLRPAPGPMAAIQRAAGMDPAVVLTDVIRVYGGGRAGALGLPRISATFGAGGVHVITGPSGSGKSTLLRLVTGLDRPTAGQLVTLGQDLAELDRDARARFRAARIAIVDQRRDLVPFLSAAENVELALAIRGTPSSETPERARRALASLGLADHADRMPDELSAGERLRVAIARALAAEPNLLVLDEPTASLDRRAANNVAELLAGLDSTITILVATHDPALIEAASDRLDLAAPTAAVA
jgi:ABC-type lipoprotein export system ATPase subunit